MTDLENFKTNAPRTITFVEDKNGVHHQLKLLNSFGLPIGVKETEEMKYNVHNLYTVNDDALDKLVALECKDGEPENNKVKLLTNPEELFGSPNGHQLLLAYLDKLHIIRDALGGKELTH